METTWTDKGKDAVPINYGIAKGSFMKAKRLVAVLLACLFFGSATGVSALDGNPDTRGRKVAVAQGNADAQHALGQMYLQGKAVPQNYAKARAYLEKAARQGHAAAQLQLGIMHSLGLGGPRDWKQARTWWEKSAGQGNAMAQFLLGLMFERGIDAVRQDYAEAVRWYRESASQGYAKAQTALGRMFLLGKGVQNAGSLQGRR